MSWFPCCVSKCEAGLELCHQVCYSPPRPLSCRREPGKWTGGYPTPTWVAGRGWQSGTMQGGPIYRVTSASQPHQGDRCLGMSGPGRAGHAVCPVPPGCCNGAGAYVTGLGASCVLPVPCLGHVQFHLPAAVHNHLLLAVFPLCPPPCSMPLRAGSWKSSQSL